MLPSPISLKKRNRSFDEWQDGKELEQDELQQLLSKAWEQECQMDLLRAQIRVRCFGR
jgi:hypothetical protein